MMTFEDPMKLAAYQAPLLPGGSMEALELIRDRIKWCEAEGVDILCCPEAVLGGLADDAERPVEIAVDVESGQLEALLAPLASKVCNRDRGVHRNGRRPKAV